MSSKKCPQCYKNQPTWAFKNDSDVCMFCDSDKIKSDPIKKHKYETVEDKGCAGGACTL